MNNKPYQQEFDDILVSTNKKLLNLNFIHLYLSTKSHWALNISFANVQKSIENSMCFGVFKNNVQVGFGRLITDQTTFAYLADVFIIDEEQHKGLGKLLLQTIHQHPNLQGLRRWMLATRDAHTLYEKFGWNYLDNLAASKLMMIGKPNIYLPK